MSALCEEDASCLFILCNAKKRERGRGEGRAKVRVNMNYIKKGSELSVERNGDIK